MRRRPPSRTPQDELEEPGFPAGTEDARSAADPPGASASRQFRFALTRGIIVSSLIAALLFAALGYASVIRRPAVYQSTAILLIDQPLLVAGASGEGVLRKLAALRVKYAVLARTRRLTTPVAEKLNVPVAEVARSLVVSATGPSLAVFVTARSASPKRAQEIANGSADEIIKYTAEEHEANKVPPEERVIFTVIDPAFSGQKIEPTGERARLIAALAAALGFAAVFGVGQLFPKRSR